MNEFVYTCFIIIEENRRCHGCLIYIRRTYIYIPNAYVVELLKSRRDSLTHFRHASFHIARRDFVP